MVIDQVTKEMWRRAMEDPDEAHELLLILEVVGEGQLVKLTHLDVGGHYPIRIEEATSEQAHFAICSLCPEWAKHS